MLLLSLLAACNPEHNAFDVAKIDRLSQEVDDLDAKLTTIRQERDALQVQVDELNEQVTAFVVVGQAWYTATHQPVGSELVVCQPNQGDTTLTNLVDPSSSGSNDQKSPVTPAVRTAPWVQPSVSADCGEPMVLSLVIPSIKDEPETVATTGSYDGPTLSAAPSKEVEEDVE